MYDSIFTRMMTIGEDKLIRTGMDQGALGDGNRAYDPHPSI